jgi:hypothetical protein
MELLEEKALTDGALERKALVDGAVGLVDGPSSFRRKSLS